MLAVPALTPVINPVAELIVATPVLLLLQVPPLVALVKVVVAPTHIVFAPLIAGVLQFMFT
jgi:hypothetical protein